MNFQTIKNLEQELKVQVVDFKEYNGWIRCILGRECGQGDISVSFKRW